MVLTYPLHLQGLVERGSVTSDSTAMPVVVDPPLQEADLTKEVLQDMLDRAQQSDDVPSEPFRERAVCEFPENSKESSFLQKISSLGLFKAVFRYRSGLSARTNLPAPFFI